MVTQVVRIFILVLLPSMLAGQSLNLSVTSPTDNNNQSTFLLEEGEVTIGSNSIRFLRSGVSVSGYEAMGISSDKSMVSLFDGTQEGGKIAVLNSRGDTLTAYSTSSLARNDPSLAVYPANNGSVLFQNNITNFTFYDRLGEIYASMSSSSQSKQGEAISKVALSPAWRTMVIYNPKIKLNNSLGSKAQVKLSDTNFKQIFYSSDRFLKDVTVSENGNIVVAVTASQGTDDQALIMDKYGNTLNRISTDENLIGTSLSANNDYVTLYSGRRVMVYSLPEGERQGATSLREPVFMADYFPKDNLILALTGDYSEQSNILRNVGFQGVNLEKRSITSEEFSGTLGFTDAIDTKIKRISADEYQLTGASQRVKIEANF